MNGSFPTNPYDPPLVRAELVQPAPQRSLEQRLTEAEKRIVGLERIVIWAVVVGVIAICLGGTLVIIALAENRPGL